MDGVDLGGTSRRNTEGEGLHWSSESDILESSSKRSLSVLVTTKVASSF